MFKFLRDLDGRVLLFAALGCYALPILVFGTLISASLAQSPDGWGQPATVILLLIFFLLSPLAAGYFTARYARNRPQLHVLLVWAIGFAAFIITSAGSLGIQAAVGVASFASVSLGAFVRLRAGKRNQ